MAKHRKEVFRLIQGNLFDTPIVHIGKCTTLKEEFEEFDRRNPHVWEELKRRAWKLVQRKVRRIGIKMLYEAIRYDYYLQTDGKEFKLNNNYTAFYARRLAAQPWMPSGVIELRKRRADDYKQ